MARKRGSSHYEAIRKKTLAKLRKHMSEMVDGINSGEKGSRNNYFEEQESKDPQKET